MRWIIKIIKSEMRIAWLRVEILYWQLRVAFWTTVRWLVGGR